MSEIERQSLGKGHLGIRKIGNGHSLLGFPGGSVDKESTCNAGDLSWIPGLGRSLGEGNSYTLQHSGMENPMDCIVHGVAKSRTQLSNFHFHFFSSVG